MRLELSQQALFDRTLVVLDFDVDQVQASVPGIVRRFDSGDHAAAVPDDRKHAIAGDGRRGGALQQVTR